ncbi:hypothetical protein EBR43_09530 [bacterium]|nr:hypothetical protein [bacterium]
MAYTPLKDLYLEQVIFKPVPPLPRQQVRSLLSEQDIEVPTMSAAPTETLPATTTAEQPAIQPAGFDPGQVTEWTAWADVNVPGELFDIVASGTGRGEFSVASFLSGLKTKKEIEKENLVQGGNVSYDVKYNNREYEVKEVKDGDLDVRIGAEGVDTANTLKEGLIAAAKIIKKLYGSLAKDTQEEVNNLLRKKFKSEKFNLSVYTSKFNEGKLYELPSSLIAEPDTFVSRQSKNWALEPSILTAIDAILNLDSSQTMSGTPGAKNSRIQALLDLVSKKEMYGVEDEKSNFYKEIEKDLETLDQELISKRCEFSDDEKYCTTLDAFVQEIKNRNLLEDVRNLINTFKSDILGIFPKEASFAGLFIVDASKFKYIPKDKLSTFIENYRLSFGKPKIRLKK